MGVSFKISRTRTRIRPKLVIPDSNSVKEVAENSLNSSKIPSNNASNVSSDFFYLLAIFTCPFLFFNGVDASLCVSNFGLVPLSFGSSKD